MTNKEIKGLKIPREILNDNNLNYEEKTLLSALYQLKGKEDTIYTTTYKLQEITGLSKDFVNKKLLYFNNKYIIYCKNKANGIDFQPFYEARLSNKNSLFIPNNILLNKGLKSYKEKYVLAYLTSFTRNKKECFTNNNTLCELFNVSERVLDRYLKRFESLGLIDKTYSSKRGFIKIGREIKANLDKIENYYQNCVVINQTTTNNIENQTNIDTQNNIENQTNIDKQTNIDTQNNILDRSVKLYINLPAGLTAEQIQTYIKELTKLPVSINTGTEG